MSSGSTITTPTVGGFAPAGQALLSLCDRLHSAAIRESKKFVVENEASALAAARLRAEVARLASDEQPTHYLSMFDGYETPREGAELMFYCVLTLVPVLKARMAKNEHLTLVSQYRAIIGLIRTSVDNIELK